jgi:hypothetical protein
MPWSNNQKSPQTALPITKASPCLQMTSNTYFLIFTTYPPYPSQDQSNTLRPPILPGIWPLPFPEWTMLRQHISSKRSSISTILNNHVDFTDHVGGMQRSDVIEDLCAESREAVDHAILTTDADVLFGK